MDVKTHRDKAHAAAARRSVAGPRRGFTLVEMLTVIIIISILAGLIVVAAAPAIRRAREFTIRQEIAQLELALEKYKQERGDYPPDFAGVDGGATGDINLSDPGNLDTLGNRVRAAVLQHFRKAFPRYRPGACGYAGTPGTWDALIDDIRYATQDESGNRMDVDDVERSLNPATALILMLGGPPAPEDSSTKLRGFSANPANPFALGGSRLPSLYEFDETRLQIRNPNASNDNNGDGYDDNTGVPVGLPVFIPPHMPQISSDGSRAPYVYFRPRNRDYGLTLSGSINASTYFELPYFMQSLDGDICICTPYAEEALFDITSASPTYKLKRWMEPTKFQIICAGLDGLFSKTIEDQTGVTDNDVKFKYDDFVENVRLLYGEDTNVMPEEDDNITNFTEGKLADRAEE